MVSDTDLDATFFCGFCNAEYDWPFGGRIVWEGKDIQQTFPEAAHVIMSHHFGDSNLTKFGFPQCPNVGRWKDTTWEAINQDTKQRIAGGKVEVVEGYPSVTQT